MRSRAIFHRHVLDRAHLNDARIIHQHIDAAEVE
jgi:hypothetical protein